MVFTPNSPTPTRRSLEREKSFLPLQPDGAWSASEVKVIDGPPYANGPIHIGHAMNKILKDMTARFSGTALVPAWDCHGLPIEWLVEKRWREEGRDKNTDRDGFLADCEAHARAAVETQMEQFIELGVVAKWHKPVLTVDRRKKIMKRFHKMVEFDSCNPLVYSALKPTQWSPAEQTALSGAEMEEKTIKTKSAYVAFSLGEEATPLLVWTTSPWSLVGNAGVAFNPLIPYGVFDIDGTEYILAEDCPLADKYRDSYVRRHVLDESLKVRHPITGKYVPVMAASFVTSQKGTGLVHVGPAHSEDDWRLWMAKYPNEAYPDLVNQDGFYSADAPAPFAGTKVTGYARANELMLDHLGQAGSLVLSEDQSLDIPVSWRSGCPLVIRPTRQFFLDIGTTKRGATDRFDFTSPSAKERFDSMVANRKGDWLISRQRLWGTPMGIYVRDGEIVRDKRILKATRRFIDRQGFGEWLNDPHACLMGLVSDPSSYEAVSDVLDVWFDSGAIGSDMMRDEDCQNVLIEGSDQSRGWFQSLALIQGLSFDYFEDIRVLTHGFVVDKNGHKMSKSKGNGVTPSEIIDQYGADALRIWVASTDVNDDLRISDAIMKTHAETGRKLRTYLRYMAGAVDGIDVTWTKEDPEIIEQMVLVRFDEFFDKATELVSDMRYPKFMSLLNEFMTNTMSGFWFESRKDTIYCDALDDPKRQAVLRLMKMIFVQLTRLIGPVMPFLIEELRRDNPNAFDLGMDFSPENNHQHIRNRYSVFLDETFVNELMTMRKDILKDIEALRASGLIKKASECRLIFTPTDNPNIEHALTLATGCSEFLFDGDERQSDEAGWRIVVSGAVKCDRCWREHSTTVLSTKEEYAHLCSRCDTVIEG